MRKKNFNIRQRAALRPAIFVDRDGTLNEMVYDAVHGLLDSPRRPEQVALKKHAPDFLKGVRRQGFLVAVATNQPGLAKGTLTEHDLARVNGRLATLLRKADKDARWDLMLVCPHHPQGDRKKRPDLVRNCDCRKPKPGLMLQAAREHGIDLSRSWMVGDGLNDVQAGRAAGCRTILVTSLKIEQIERFFGRGGAEPDFIARDLREALRIIRKDGKP